MSLDLTYAEAEDLANLVRDSSKVPGVDYLVLDVRGDDFAVSYIMIFKYLFSHIFDDLGRPYKRSS
jgi:hypothetical protein